MDTIYFISTGKVKLYVDLLHYVDDKELREKVLKFEGQSANNLKEFGFASSFRQIKPSLMPMVVHSVGGYFGDADLLSYMMGKHNNKGRDLSAIGFNASLLFLLNLKEIHVIGDRFPKIYREMTKNALKRHKHH